LLKLYPHTHVIQIDEFSLKDNPCRAQDVFNTPTPRNNASNEGICRARTEDLSIYGEHLGVRSEITK
jgi:hypothetical protein